MECRITLATDRCTALTFRFLVASWWRIHSHVVEFLSAIFARFHVCLYIPQGIYTVWIQKKGECCVGWVWNREGTEKLVNGKQHSVWFVPTGMKGLPQNVLLNFRLEFPKSDLTIYLPSGISEIFCQMVSTPAASLRYSTTQFHHVSLRHDDMKFNAAFFFFKGFSAKQQKKPTKRKSLQRYRAKRIKRQLYGKYYKMFASKNDWSKWPARREFDRSSPRSGRTLSVDRPLFWALPWLNVTWMMRKHTSCCEPLFLNKWEVYLAWNSSDCFESFSPLNNVWIDQPLMPSSDVTHYPKTG